MKTLKFLLVLLILLCSNSFTQNIYEVTPGTKRNEITLKVSNVSETNPANYVNVILTKKSSSLIFSKEEATIENIEAKAEEVVKFIFEVNRNAPINKKDTIEFMITDNSGTSLLKSFIFNYTAPKEFKLDQNFPNPFNPATTIQYQLPANSKVTLKVYDILGSEVTTLVNEEQQPGYYEVKFNGSSITSRQTPTLSSGMYIYRLQAEDFVSTKKMILLK